MNRDDSRATLAGIVLDQGKARGDAMHALTIACMTEPRNADLIDHLTADVDQLTAQLRALKQLLDAL